MTEYGWDLSNHDWERHSVDMADAKRAGISLVTHKATEGTTYRDPYLGPYMQQLARVPFPVAGTYHVPNHGIDAAAQTDFWTSYVWSRNAAVRDHPCWIWQIDAEPLDGYAAPTKAEILACGQRLENRHGVDPASIVVYGPKWVYGDRLTGIPYKLWASSYVNGSGAFKTLYPGDHGNGWGEYSAQVPAIWQFSSSARIGAQSTCDANAIRVSTEAQLQALFKSRAAPDPAPLVRKRPDMFVYRIDPATVPKGKTASGWFIKEAGHVSHIDGPEGKVNNGNAVLAALGQSTPATVTYQQHADWQAGK